MEHMKFGNKKGLLIPLQQRRVDRSQIIQLVLRGAAGYGQIISRDICKGLALGPRKISRGENSELGRRIVDGGMSGESWGIGIRFKGSRSCRSRRSEKLKSGVVEAV